MNGALGLACGCVVYFDECDAAETDCAGVLVALRLTTSLAIMCDAHNHCRYCGARMAVSIEPPGVLVWQCQDGDSVTNPHPYRLAG